MKSCVYEILYEKILLVSIKDFPFPVTWKGKEQKIMRVIPFSWFHDFSVKDVCSGAVESYGIESPCVF